MSNPGIESLLSSVGFVRKPERSARDEESGAAFRPVLDEALAADEAADKQASQAADDEAHETGETADEAAAAEVAADGPAADEDRDDQDSNEDGAAGDGSAAEAAAVTAVAQPSETAAGEPPAQDGTATGTATADDAVGDATRSASTNAGGHLQNSEPPTDVEADLDASGGAASGGQLDSATAGDDDVVTATAEQHSPRSTPHSDARTDAPPATSPVGTNGKKPAKDSPRTGHGAAEALTAAAGGQNDAPQAAEPNENAASDARDAREGREGRDGRPTEPTGRAVDAPPAAPVESGVATAAAATDGDALSSSNAGGETPPTATAAGEAAPTATNRGAETLARLSAGRAILAAAPGDGDGATVDRARFIGRVEGAIRSAQQRDGRVQVRLSPPELGALRIELTLQQGVLSARVEADTAAARNLLLDNLPALRERLAQQDVRIERFDVDVRRDGGGSGQNGTHDRSARDSADWRPAPRRSEPVRTAAASSRTTAAGGVSDAALDVRV